MFHKTEIYLVGGSPIHKCIFLDFNFTWINQCYIHQVLLHHHPPEEIFSCQILRDVSDLKISFYFLSFTVLD